MVTSKRRRFEIRQKQKRKAKRVIVAHALTRGGFTAPQGMDPFVGLQKILVEGFKPKPLLNVFVGRTISDKGFLKKSNLPETFGDSYSIEMLTHLKRDEYLKGKPLSSIKGHYANVPHAFPEQIKKITIRLNPEISEAEREKRIEFYKKTFPNKTIEFI